MLDELEEHKNERDNGGAVRVIILIKGLLDCPRALGQTEKSYFEL